MESNVFIGHHCPKCGTTVGVATAVGSSLKCPGCGGPMQAAPGGPSVKVLSNVKCKQCGSSFGVISVVGAQPNCPCCGSALS